MYPFKVALQQRTWRELRAMSYAHGLPFNVRFTKEQVCDHLHGMLVTRGALRHCLSHLDTQAYDALAALQAADGPIPLHRFEAIYGSIRRYRPWRQDAPRHPWRHPISLAERLWFLGLIAIIKARPGQPRSVYVPDEVLVLLPPLPKPFPLGRPTTPSLSTPQALLVDVAAFIGTLAGMQVQSRSKRWLPPFALKAINQRLHIRDDLSGVRSELQTERLRLLHYLAHAAGLVESHDGMIVPTLAAWNWLALTADQQWGRIWKAWTADITSPTPLWTIYRFPKIAPVVWHGLVQLLSSLIPAQEYSLQALANSLYPLAFDTSLETLPDLLMGPLTWAGLLTVNEDRFALTQQGVTVLSESKSEFPDLQPTEIMLDGDIVQLHLPEAPPLHAFARLCAWATVRDGIFTVDSAALRRALEQGTSHLEIAHTLSSLALAPLPGAVFQTLEHCARAAGRLTLRHMAVLTSPESELLTQFRRDRRLRSFFVEQFSEHHAGIRPDAAEALCQQLARRGIDVTVRTGTGAPPITGNGAASGLASYLWLAVHVYRRLATWADPPVHIPSAVLDHLEAQLTSEQLDALEQAAETLLDDLAGTMAGNVALPAPVAQEGSATIRAALDEAYRTREEVVIEYLSPAYGAPAIRTVTPITPIDVSEGAEYFEAWCSTAQATRAFRVDRIIRIIPPEARADTPVSDIPY